MRRAPALLASAVAACAGPAATDDPLAGRIAGEPVSCIGIGTGVAPVAYDRDTILVRDGRRLWRTGPTGACPALGRAPVTLIIDVQGAQLCRNDRFQVLEIGSSIPSAPCFFDRFTPYDAPRGRTG